jgi:hypothetical protein
MTQSAEGVCSSMTPCSTFALLEGWGVSCCPTPDWYMYLWCILLLRLLPSLNDIFKFTVYHQEHLSTTLKTLIHQFILFFIFIVILNIVWHSSIISMGVIIRPFYRQIHCLWNKILGQVHASNSKKAYGGGWMLH